MDSTYTCNKKQSENKLAKDLLWVHYGSLAKSDLVVIFNVLVQWDGIQVDDNINVHFSLAPFSL